MAFRIHESVVRGEIDNRAKGIVHGRIWVVGRADPILLELTGNTGPDLAGCLLSFKNPARPQPHPHLNSLHPLQRGAIGDLTASRKVRVFNVPLEQALAMIRRQEKPPEHLANSLYLEWFSEANGRVVIESADYELTISAPEWRMAPGEEAERAEQAAAGMVDFMKRLTDAIELDQGQHKSSEEPWDEHDYERFLKECDARTNKYLELLDRYGDSGEAEAKIAQEMGWGGSGDGMPIEEMNAMFDDADDGALPAPDPHREGIDWIRVESGDFRHPLQHRCSESAMKFRRQTDQLGLDKTKDKDLEQFIFEFQTTGAKLAGALNPIARGAVSRDAAFTVALLKRALDHLHKSQAGLEAFAPGKLFNKGMVLDARKELFEIREGVLHLMEYFRRRG